MDPLTPCSMAARSVGNGRLDQVGLDGRLQAGFPEEFAVPQAGSIPEVPARDLTTGNPGNLHDFSGNIG